MQLLSFDPFLRRSRLHALGAALACLLAVPGAAYSQGQGHDALITVAEFKAGKARAEAELAADRAACEQFAGNRRDLCRERAIGKQRVARAELDVAHTGTHEARENLASVKLAVAYDIERTICNDKERSDRPACAQQAQAARTRGEDAQKARFGPAERVAAAGQREADYRREAQKCGDVPVEARGACLTVAKARADKR